MQFLLKYLSFINYKHSIGKILNDIATRFWKHQFYDKKISERSEKIFALIEKTQQIMFMLTMLGMVTYFMKPFFVVNQGLLIHSFVPISDATAALVVISQFYCFCTGYPVVIGYDFCYFAVCTHVILQLKLLKQHIKNTINQYDVEIEVEMGKSVRQHQFLFK